MRFRPCIDIHNGRVKQIVGSTLSDKGDRAAENFVSEQDAGFFARMYREKGLLGGHVILLNSKDSPFYPDTRKQAIKALKAYPGGLQAGGGIRDDNAHEFLDAGASHVIVTSFVFKDGEISYGNLEKMVRSVGKEHLVLDLSCRKRGDSYYVVTDRWQKFTNVKVDKNALQELGSYCSEFLIHAVDVEGKASGIEKGLVEILAEYGERPMTYAGGVGSFQDLRELAEHGQGKLDVTIGSALDIFGGPLAFQEVLDAFH